MQFLFGYTSSEEPRELSETLAYCTSFHLRKPEEQRKASRGRNTLLLRTAEVKFKACTENFWENLQKSIRMTEIQVFETTVTNMAY